MAHHPYESLPADRFWRKAVAGVAPFELAPADAAPFRLARTDRIAAAGSCFAQHVSRALRATGLDFIETEPDADGLSARYGNIYTTRQLVQLFERAFGAFTPVLSHWERDDGRFVDPFRPRAVPAGFASPEEVVSGRAAHLRHVADMFRSLDVLVFTLGLTEGWRDVEDGAALPLPPGAAGGVFEPERYAFVNATVAEMTADLLRFTTGLKTVNPRARIVLTVSPVAIIATYEPRHVLVSNAFSKAALRVVADEVSRARPEVAYFPSYEIVTAPTNIGRYIDEDLRTVTPAGVDHVMRFFLTHAEGGAAGAGPAPLDIGRETEAVSGVVCDEDLLEA